ncbi:MAG: hypothetical protein K0R14_2212 [Burkholderiales bacterium]|jgi:predicted transcriptional regulator|nr:hypothetical protein [Burkholderiales bacterium]
MSTFLSARIDESTNLQLIAIANQENQTRTDIVKAALDLYLEHRQSKLVKQMSILHSLENTENGIEASNVI